jgi:hypothetical protein
MEPSRKQLPFTTAVDRGSKTRASNFGHLFGDVVIYHLLQLTTHETREQSCNMLVLCFGRIRLIMLTHYLQESIH